MGLKGPQKGRGHRLQLLSPALSGAFGVYSSRCIERRKKSGNSPELCMFISTFQQLQAWILLSLKQAPCSGNKIVEQLIFFFLFLVGGKIFSLSF